MPSSPLLRCGLIARGVGTALVLGLLCTAGMGAESGVSAGSGSPSPQVTAIRSQRAALAYRLSGADRSAAIELWYTRDRGVTWTKYGIHEDHSRPLLFEAPAEGLYGLLMIPRSAGETSEAPAANTKPQRWIFVDYTPPLVQWTSVVPGDTFSSRRTVRLSWTAHDDHLPSRPISLSYQSSIDQTWQVIDAALPNTGRYDWNIPAELAGQVTLKLAVRDLGGHVVERMHGPIPLDRWLSAPVIVSPTTRPAEQVAGTTSRPAAPDLTSAKWREAEHLYKQGSWHLLRGQHALAAARFRDALEINPDMPEALNDLGGLYYLQSDYDKALDYYGKVLAKNANHPDALRGSALAYVAQRQYAQSRDMLRRLLKSDEKNAEAWLDLGDVLFMMGQQEDALSHWNQASRLIPSADRNPALQEVLRKARRRLDLYGAGSGTEVAEGQR